MATGGLKKFIDDNTKGPLAKGFLALSIAEIATADNKLKALIKTLASMLLWKPLIAVGLAGAFRSMSKAVRQAVLDTGSLEAALRRLKTIQGLQRALAPFVGGIEVARRRVAELVLFTNRANIDLAGAGEAAVNLQKLTKGAWAGVEAIGQIADSAQATDNTMGAVSTAVGEAYQTLRDGLPFESTAERLFDMGLISDGARRHLVGLAAAGAANFQIFEELKKALADQSQALSGAKGELKGVEEAYRNAQEALRVKFGEPFTEANIQNMKNWTTFMLAIAPVVERVAPFLQKLTGGFSTLASWLAKTAAESPVLRDTLSALVIVLGSTVAAVSMLAGIGLGVWMFSAAGAVSAAAASLLGFAGASGIAATAISALSVAIRIAMAATGVGLIFVALGSAAAVMMEFANSTDKASESLERQRKSAEATNKALADQVKNARNVREANEAAAKAAENTKTMEAEWAAATKAKMEEQRGFMGLWSKDASPEAIQREENARQAVLEARRIEKEAKDKANPNSTIKTPERAAAERDVERAKARIGDREEQVVQLDNLDRFAQNFERMKEQFGDTEEARKNALLLSQADIQGGATMAATRLAQIGLGGEVGREDVSKQIRDLQQDAVEYLKLIDAKLSPPPGELGRLKTEENPVM